MPINLTVTAKIGAGATATALVLNGLQEIRWKIGQTTDGSQYKVLEAIGPESDQVRQFDVNASTTVTHTISGATHTVTVS